MTVRIDNKYTELNVELTFYPKVQNYDDLKILAKIISHLITNQKEEDFTKPKNLKNFCIEGGKKICT